MQEMYSIRPAAMSFILELCQNRPKELPGIMTHVGSVLDTCKPKVATGDEAAARQYYAAMYVVANLEEVLKKKVSLEGMYTTLL